MIKNDLRGQEVFLQVKSLETSGEHWAWIGALCFSHYIFTQCPLESKEMGEELPQKSVEKKTEMIWLYRAQRGGFMIISSSMRDLCTESFEPVFKQRSHDEMDSARSDFTFMHWRRKWQPTPVFLPGESQGWGSLVGCRLWGRTESDTTEVT